jgi:hypothetical protein
MRALLPSFNPFAVGSLFLYLIAIIYVFFIRKMGCKISWLSC